jgi:VanZ family protein
LQDISLYVKICVDVAILFYTFIISIIVHCYFSKALPSQAPKTESILEFIRYYKQINNEQPLFLTKKDVLETILYTTIPELEKLKRKRANIFNYSIKTVFAFFAITNIAICILTF